MNYAVTQSHCFSALFEYRHIICHDSTPAVANSKLHLLHPSTHTNISQNDSNHDSSVNDECDQDGRKSLERLEQQE